MTPSPLAPDDNGDTPGRAQRPDALGERDVMTVSALEDLARKRAVALGLPEWDLEPPAFLVERRKWRRV